MIREEQNQLKYTIDFTIIFIIKQLRNLNHISLYTITFRAIHNQVAIIGGGCAGLNVSAQLVRDGHYIPQQIRVFEPYKMHAYQTGGALVGAGMCNVEKTMRPMEMVLPKNVQQNTIVTIDGKKYPYYQLIVASGVQRDFASIKGINISLSIHQVLWIGSIYYYKYAQKIDRIIKEFKGGRLIFSQPSSKCEGIPSNIIICQKYQM
ncbi:unnamed protein product (macronuclear) [Paramecium tetraurelia]|uniref:FAD/NAD(P)-binding domain-containing protein n=1 Tax=Paramecium tetraurelia TaxID=5888 RepID=A0BKY3_PARTE|nr:uncharacterized protein GSPATT00029831001 [Paramecium tetraurelia]CAK59200.1 unnamed protein product [Paramecium tetraurelia]|eukprot:XP_001426598.1 hypothetical protein (macronuclear) [Paramecium tetraurelia strain d4-2]